MNHNQEKFFYLKDNYDLKPGTWYHKDTMLQKAFFVVGDQSDSSTSAIGVVVGSEISPLSGTQRFLNEDIVEVKNFKETFDWSLIPKEFNFAAVDENGKIYVYSDDVEVEDDQFMLVDIERRSAAMHIGDIKLFQEDWRDTKIKRP